MSLFLHHMKMWRGVIWRVALIGAVWALSPWWVFGLIATILYFSEWLQGLRLFPLLAGILLVAALLPHTFLSGIFVVALFFILFGVKELLFVEREAAYEVLFLAIFFAVSTYSFYRLEQWDSPWEIMVLAIVPLLFYWMGRGMLHYIGTSQEDVLGQSVLNSGMAVLALIVWEMSVVILFLPVHFLYQAAMLFSFSYIMLELAFFEARGKLTRSVVFSYSALFVAVWVITLTASEWRF